MLYQLSYSPKELGNLASDFCGYSCAVQTEADVYPNGLNTASTNRKKGKPGSAPMGPTRAFSVLVPYLAPGTVRLSALLLRGSCGGGFLFLLLGLLLGKDLRDD